MENKILFEDLNTVCSDKNIQWEELTNRVILVTGATGLIGSLLIKSLLHFAKLKNVHIEIIAHVRNKDKAKVVFSDYIHSSLLTVMDCELSDLQYSVKKIDYILHSACPTASEDFIKKPVEVIDFIYESTKSLLEFTKKNVVKSFLYISTMEVYGNLQKNKITEKDFGSIDPCIVRSSYPEGKKLAETLCTAYASEYNIPVKIARLTQCFGAGVDISNDKRVFAEFANSIIYNKDIVLLTKGETQRCYIYTADAVRALLTILLTGKVQEAYNIANMNTFISIFDMAKQLCNHYRINLVVKEDPSASKKFASTQYMLLDTTKLEKLGWEPKYNLQTMFERMIEFLQT